MSEVRQGDVYLRRVDGIPENAKQQQEAKEIVVALGETTGHSHRLQTMEKPILQFITPDGKVYLETAETGQLVHDEHQALTIEVGTYEVIHQREYVPGPVRETRVRD